METLSLRIVAKTMNWHILLLQFLKTIVVIKYKLKLCFLTLAPGLTKRPHEKYLIRREIFVNVNRPIVIIMLQGVLPQVQVPVR